MEATSRYAKALRATVERDPRSGGCRGAASFNPPELIHNMGDLAQD